MDTTAQMLRITGPTMAELPVAAANGGGNHFGEAEVVQLVQNPAMRKIGDRQSFADECVGLGSIP